MMKNLKIICFFLFTINFVFGQIQQFSPKVQSFYEYENSLKGYHRKMWEAEKQEFQVLNQKPILFYLPDIGLQFGLPSINFKLSNYLQYKRDQEIIEQKLKSINEKGELELNNQLQQLKIEYQKLKLEFDRLKTAQERMILIEKIYLIGSECCQKRACTPEDCRKQELEHFEQKQGLIEAEINFDIMVLEFEKFAKYKLPEYKF